MASISTLTDNFDDNSIAAVWNDTSAGVVETNQQIEITGTGSGWKYLGTLNTYDLTGSQATIKIVDVSTDTQYPLCLFLGNDAVVWEIASGGAIRAIFYEGGSETQYATATYNADIHRYLKIREVSGTTYFDYSANGLSWTNFASVANPFVITAITPNVAVLYNTGFLKVDDFNILPSGGATGILSPKTGYWGDL